MSTVYWPSRSPSVTEEAGTRGGAHSGIDLKANLGDPVIASFDGEVVFVGGDGATGPLWIGYWLYPNGEGKTVDIRRADGLISRVGHLSGYAVKPGQKVKAGQVIGYAGSTGYSTGVHIHWELRWDRIWGGGRWENPRKFNPKTYTEPKPSTPATTSVGKGDKMFMIALPKGAPNKKDTLFAVVGSQFWLEFSGQAAANNLIRQITGTDKFNALIVSESFWGSCKKAAQTGKNR